MFLAGDSEQLQALIDANSTGKWGYLLISAFITLLFAFLAAAPAARFAARVSPVRAMSGTGVSVKRRKRTTGKIRSFERYYARLNLSRSRGRTAVTVLSLIMSITVFITLQSFLSLLGVSGSLSEHLGDYSIVNPYEGISPKELQEMEALAVSLVTPRRIMDALDDIRALDFSAFYRETTYTSEEYGVVREYVQAEILPDFILMPNAGVRGAMWQEIEGKRRMTPSRMMLSVIALEDISQLLTRMTGEFRWEMCKRVQGARWNDISEPSLTSEYTDYIQFYKKNRDLSPDAKEKLRLSLQRAKNSVKEMFVRDYMLWITYEGNGSPRLNKVARPILFTYCPFSAAIRQNLVQHPLYMETVNKYKLLLSQKLHHLDMLCNKLEKNFGTVPEEIQNQIKFLKS